MKLMPYDDPDFPLRGALGRFLTWLVPQRDPDLSDDLIRQAPSTTFIGLFKNILKDKNAVWFLTTGYILETLFTAIYISIPLVIGKFMSHVIEDGKITSENLMTVVLVMVGMLSTCAIINFLGVRQADRSRASGEALTRRQLTWWALGHSAGWFSKREAGQIAHRISEVSRQVNVVLGQIVWDIFPIIVALLMVTAIMYLTDLYAGLFFSIWTAIFLIISIKMGLISQKL
jgi:ABC-type multidrug transport system fused ATPase/permease subunit